MATPSPPRSRDRIPEVLGETDSLWVMLWAAADDSRHRRQPKSVADRKPLAGVSRPLQFINQRDGEVLKGNLALAVGADQ